MNECKRSRSGQNQLSRKMTGLAGKPDSTHVTWTHLTPLFYNMQCSLWTTSVHLFVESALHQRLSIKTRQKSSHRKTPHVSKFSVWHLISLFRSNFDNFSAVLCRFSHCPERWIYWRFFFQALSLGWVLQILFNSMYCALRENCINYCPRIIGFLY